MVLQKKEVELGELTKPSSEKKELAWEKTDLAWEKLVLTSEKKEIESEITRELNKELISNITELTSEKKELKLEKTELTAENEEPVRGKESLSKETLELESEKRIKKSKLIYCTLKTTNASIIKIKIKDEKNRITLKNKSNKKHKKL